MNLKGVINERIYLTLFNLGILDEAEGDLNNIYKDDIETGIICCKNFMSFSQLIFHIISFEEMKYKKKFWKAQFRRARSQMKIDFDDLPF